MANFAVLDGDNVVNAIIADSKEIAEQITGKVCVEYGPNDRAEPGGTYINNVFIPRKPHPDWVLNSNNEWEPPFTETDSL